MQIQFPESLIKKFGKHFNANEMIFAEYERGKTCFFLLSGKIKIMKFISGRQKNVDTISEGNFFGEMAILEEASRTASAISIGNSVVLVFAQKDFDTLLHIQPQMGYELLCVLARRIFDAKRKQKILLLDDDQAKVSDVFVMLSEQNPNYANATEITLDVTPEDVASWCALDPKKVRDILAGFVLQGKVDVFANRITVKNVNDFKRTVQTKRRKQVTD